MTDRHKAAKSATRMLRSRFFYGQWSVAKNFPSQFHHHREHFPGICGTKRTACHFQARFPAISLSCGTSVSDANQGQSPLMRNAQAVAGHDMMSHQQDPELLVTLSVISNACGSLVALLVGGRIHCGLPDHDVLKPPDGNTLLLSPGIARGRWAGSPMVGWLLGWDSLAARRRHGLDERICASSDEPWASWSQRLNSNRTFRLVFQPVSIGGKPAPQA